MLAIARILSKTLFSSITTFAKEKVFISIIIITGLDIRIIILINSILDL